MEQLITMIKKILTMSSPCLFHALTGWYCPGCGGTRAVIYLLTGHPILSVLYHPIVMYTAIVAGYLLIRNGISILSHNHLCTKAKFHIAYLWIALALVLGNFVIKNAALILWGIDLMPNK